MSIYAFIKSDLIPGSITLLFLLLGAGVVLLWIDRTRRIGRWAVTGTIVAYWVLATKLGVRTLTWVVAAPYGQLADSARLADVAAVVVLEAGGARYESGRAAFTVVDRSSAQRTAEALRVLRLRPGAIVVASGGSASPATRSRGVLAMRDILLSNGIPAERIVVDSMSPSSRRHAARVPGLLRERGITRFALVTSRPHMRRAMREFRAAGAQPVPAPAPAPTAGTSWFWPSIAALQQSYEAAYELLGLAASIVRP